MPCGGKMKKNTITKPAPMKPMKAKKFKKMEKVKKRPMTPVGRKNIPKP